MKLINIKKDYRLSYAFANMAMGSSIALVAFTLNTAYCLIFVAGFMVAYQDYHKLKNYKNY